MKVKLLLFPLSIAIAIAVSIFWTQPEVASIFSLRTQDGEIVSQLAQIDRVISNINALNQSLDENAANEQFVKSYLPETGSDDRILDEINFLSSESGLLLVSTGLKRVSSDVAQAAAQSLQAASDKAEVDSATPGSALINTLGSTSSSTVVFVSSSPEARVRSTDVSISAFGKYDQIKAFVDRIYRANSFQNFVAVKVSHKSSTTSTPSSAAPSEPDVLSVDITVRFGVLPPAVVSRGTFLDTFNKPTFDLAIVQNLRDRVTHELPVLDASSSGRPNPFLR